MSKLPEDELLRLACIYAERDQQALADAHIRVTGPEYYKALEFVRQIREYRLKRWGKTRFEAEMDSARTVSIEELRMNHEQNLSYDD